MSYRPLAPVLERPSLFDFHENTSFSSTLGMQQGKRAEVDEKLLHEAFTQVSAYPDKGLRALLEIIWSHTFYLDENLEPVQGSKLAEQIFAQVRQVVPDDPRFASCANGDNRAGTSSANGEQAGSAGEAQSIYTLFTENNMCLICGKKIDRITSALGHVRSDIGHRPFHCDCQKCSSSPNPRRFFSEILLYLHQKGQAVIRICPICPICGNEIRGSLLRHMHSEHADHPESPYREK